MLLDSSSPLSTDEPILLGFMLLLPVVAFLYSSVGHGGASGYLALMALFSFSPAVMRPTALLLNLFVAGISFIYFYKNGYFKWRLFYPFAIASIPASFIGGYLSVDPVLYKRVLGVLLIFAILRMLIQKESASKSSPNNTFLALIIGMIIGFFSGLIGIGGGIILSPVLLLLGWADIKQTAAISALFIWVNSLSGFSGLLVGGVQLSGGYALFILLALAGGALGAYFGSGKRVNQKSLRYTLAFVLLLASIKLLIV